MNTLRRLQNFLSFFCLTALCYAPAFAAPATNTVEMRQYNGTGWVPLQLAPLSSAGVLKMTGAGVPSFSSTPTVDSLGIAATGGAGYIALQYQNTNPSQAGAGFLRLFVDSSINLAWYPFPTQTRVLSLNGTNLTASRAFQFPDKAGVIAVATSEDSSGNVTFPATVTATTAFTTTGAVNSGSLSNSGGGSILNSDGSGHGVRWYPTSSNGQAQLVDQNAAVGIVLDVGTADTLTVKNKAGSGWGAIAAGAGTFTGVVTLAAYTVATLPTPATGMVAYVTDSTVGITAGVGLTVVGGGANTVPVFYNGTAWKIY